MLHIHSLARIVAAIAVAGLVSGTGIRVAAAAPPEPTPPLEDRAATSVDPAATAALTRMGEYLGGLKTFELTARTTVEVVLRAGHQVEVGGVVHYWAKKPNMLRIDSDTDTVSRQYFFDGKTFTVVAPVDGFFAQAPGQAGIRETLAFAAQTLNIEVPLADLFDWGTPHAPLKLFDRGFFVGTAKIEGTETEHYALIGKDFDFEVWIQRGEQPLPLKMALVDHRAPGSPRFSALLSWKPDAAIADDVFTFTPGKDLAKIDFAKPAPTPAQPATDKKGAK